MTFVSGKWGNIMKKKILVIGITMAAAGSEKSFLSFAETIDYNRYEVDLLLAVREGDFLPLVPETIRIIDMGPMGELFKISRKNAKNIMMKRYLARNPFRALGLLPYINEMKKAPNDRERSFAANRMWLHMMKKMPILSGEYDIALAYWGDRTMFYMVDKVRAKKKIAWLHFDYAEPPREDAVYRYYFSKCDKVITVSSEIERSLSAALPEIASRVVTVENRIDRKSIRRLALESADFEDDFDGLRLVTVGRICEQKGYDLALGAVARLVNEGYPIRWYVIGAGEGDYYDALHSQITALGIEGAVRFLGIKQNPYPYMKAAYIYLQPSRHEGKPISVEEAKVLGCPILVTNYTSAHEQLDDGRLGMICEISEDDIYSGLKKMLDDNEMRADFKRNLSEFTDQNDENTLILQDFE